MTEIKITIRGEETTHSHKHLVYEPVTLSRDDPTLCKLVEAALTEFKGPVDDVMIRTAFVWH